jgi:hypothetical protein
MKTEKGESKLSAALSGDDLPAMGEEYWVRACHELSRLQVRTVEENNVIIVRPHSAMAFAGLD